jgi:hypothetical protein
MAREFADLITDLGHGEVHQRLSEDMAKIVEAVEDTGLKGKMTITITVKRTGERVAMVDLQSKLDIPRHPAPSSAFFFEEGGGLAKSDPRQQKLPLKDIERPAAGRPLRTINGGKNEDGNEQQ